MSIGQVGANPGASAAAQDSGITGGGLEVSSESLLGNIGGASGGDSSPRVQNPQQGMSGASDVLKIFTSAFGEAGVESLLGLQASILQAKVGTAADSNSMAAMGRAASGVAANL